MSRVIITEKNRGRTQYYTIYGEPSPGTYGDYLLLKNKYRSHEKPRWAHYKPEKWEQLQFNSNFLEEKQFNYGDLHCEYCGKKHLVIYSWTEKGNRENMATADHFYPVSKYPNLKKNPRNLLVSCYSCNNQKKDKIWDKSKIKYPYEDGYLCEPEGEIKGDVVS